MEERLLHASKLGNVPELHVLVEEAVKHAGGCAATDTDGPKTVEERLLHASKLRLLRFYIWAVSGYAIAYAAAILVPLFVLGEPGQEDLAVLVVSLLLDVVKWAFLAALCYIFRRAPW